MSLEKQKKKLELSRVRLAREELEFKVQERMEEIQRLEDNIQIQKDKEAELQEQLQSL